jgi:hypothetical protein
MFGGYYESTLAKKFLALIRIPSPPPFDTVVDNFDVCYDQCDNPGLLCALLSPFADVQANVRSLLTAC